MTSVTFGHQSNWSPGIGIQEHLGRAKISRVTHSYSEYCCPFLPSRETSTHHGNHVAYCRRRTGRQIRPVLAGSVDGAMDPDESDREINDSESPKPENGGVSTQSHIVWIQKKEKLNYRLLLETCMKLKSETIDL